MILQRLFWITFLVAFRSLITVSSSTRCQDISIEDIQNAFQASVIAYKDDVDIGTAIPNTGFKITQLEVENVYQGDAGVKAFLAKKDFTTIVAFRGTDGNKQLLQQLISLLQNFGGKEIIFNGTETSVNAFFWNAFQLLLPSIKNKLKDQSRKYILTGHSVGGAMASLLAIYMKDQGGEIWENPDSSLITFGQPRVGDAAYAKKHDEMIDPTRKLRFVNDRDPVPHIPAWPAVHHSREIWMARQFWTRKWYWKACSNLDPWQCSNMVSYLPNISDHDLDPYDDNVMQPPAVFEDKDSKKYGKWLDALWNTCKKS